jgi:predicted ATPase
MSDRQQLWLRSVQLERFKAVFKTDPVPLGRFTLVLGRNGAGKSTLLEALQWIDGTVREDARKALGRYYGIHDVINVRSKTKPRFFKLRLRWSLDEVPDSDVDYTVKVVEGADGFSPLVDSEKLQLTLATGKLPPLIRTQATADPKTDRAGVRLLHPNEPKLERQVTDPDRLALGRAERFTAGASLSKSDEVLAAVQEFWHRAVFLRLSSNRLASGSPARRKSFEPMLDEEGSTLPALLTELRPAQRQELIERVRRVLRDIEGLAVSSPRTGREETVNYSLKERMPFVGRRGSDVFPIPSWMLSEGTRRITAIFALLVREPAPSLLCIEELENGLDPWTVQRVLAALKDAVAKGTQVIVTSHSPWLIDHVDLGDILGVERIRGETKYRRFADIEGVKAFANQVPPGARYVNLNTST